MKGARIRREARGHSRFEIGVKSFRAFHRAIRTLLPCERMRRLYLRSRSVQWIVAACLFFGGLSLIVKAVLLLGFPKALLAIPLFLSTYQLSITPAFRLLGIYRYHSPMLKVTIRTQRFYEIHGGTNFDYLLHLRWSERGRVAARKVMILYLEGLLDIARQVAQGKLPRSITITASSYFFRDQSAERLGFTILEPGLRLRLNLMANLLDLTLMYSFTRGRLALPQIGRVRQAVIRGERLLARRGEIETMIRTLQRAPGERAEGPGPEALCA
jgi:hypothetical protein